MAPALGNRRALHLRVLALLSIVFLEGAISRNIQNSPLTPLTPFTSRASSKRQPEVERPTLRQVQNYACRDCLNADANGGTPITVRALYLEEIYTVMNPNAEAAARVAGTNYPCGSCCLDKELAVPECFEAENWNSGWVAAPIAEILTSLGANVVALTPANYSENTLEPSQGSPYERCIWEVFYGQMDVCVGSFWETGSRRSMVMFTTAIDINNFVLVTNAKLTEEFRAFSMFETFSPGVWGIMALMFLITAILMWVVQSEDAETDFDDDEVFPQPKGLAKGFWLSMMGYFAGPDPKYVTTSWAGRIIVLGYGFYLYVTVSAYTANLASFMVLKDTAKGQVADLKELVDKGNKICADSIMERMILQPGLDAESRLLSNHWGAILERLTNNDCQAAVVGKYEWRTYIQASNARYVFCNDTTDGNYMQGYFCFEPDSQVAAVDLSECTCTEEGHSTCPSDKLDCSDVFKFCNVIKVDDPSFDASVNVALPISPELEPYISSWLVKLRQDGTVNRYLASELWTNNPERCPEGTAQGNAQSTARAQALTLNGMAGTYMISGGIMFIGLMFHVFQKIAQRMSKAQAVTPTEDSPSTDHALHKESSVVGDLPNFNKEDVQQVVSADKPYGNWAQGSFIQSKGSVQSVDSHHSGGAARHHGGIRMGGYTGGKPHLRGGGDFGGNGHQFKGNKLRGSASFRNVNRAQDAVVTLDHKVGSYMGHVDDDIQGLKNQVSELTQILKATIPTPAATGAELSNGSGWANGASTNAASNPGVVVVAP